MREANRELARVSHQLEADAELRDRRRFSELKEHARRTYHEALQAATTRAQAQAAAAAWLAEIDRLNREVDAADQRAEGSNRRVAELEHAIPAIELAAEAARIAAEAAEVACLEARRVLAACEEKARLGMPTNQPPNQSPAISLILSGDREDLLSVAARLSAETGVEAGRLQLLLVELRESITACALDANALAFPADHPFWRQLGADGGQRLAASLATMGYRFDGRSGWLDGRTPALRELALALADGGYDPRSLRQPPSQAAIEDLWRGTVVTVEDFLAQRAPDLALERIVAVLGPRSAHLGELWDMWGRLRPLLLPAIAGSAA